MISLLGCSRRTSRTKVEKSFPIRLCSRMSCGGMFVRNSWHVQWSKGIDARRGRGGNSKVPSLSNTIVIHLMLRLLRSMIGIWWISSCFDICDLPSSFHDDSKTIQEKFRLQTLEVLKNVAGIFLKTLWWSRALCTSTNRRYHYWQRRQSRCRSLTLKQNGFIGIHLLSLRKWKPFHFCSWS